MTPTIPPPTPGDREIDLAKLYWQFDHSKVEGACIVRRCHAVETEVAQLHQENDRLTQELGVVKTSLALADYDREADDTDIRERLRSVLGNVVDGDSASSAPTLAGDDGLVAMMIAMYDDLRKKLRVATGLMEIYERKTGKEEAEMEAMQEQLRQAAEVMHIMQGNCGCVEDQGPCANCQRAAAWLAANTPPTEGK